MAQKGVRNIGIPEPKNVIILVVTIASSGILGRGGGGRFKFRAIFWHGKTYRFHHGSRFFDMAKPHPRVGFEVVWLRLSQSPPCRKSRDPNESHGGTRTAMVKHKGFHPNSQWTLQMHGVEPTIAWTFLDLRGQDSWANSTSQGIH